MSAVSLMFTPNPEINYSVISSMYGVCAVLCLFFYTLEFHLVPKDNENFEAIKGIYIIFVPFFPAIIWSLFMWWASRIGVGEGVEDKEKRE